MVHFDVLAQPNRRRILDLLLEGEQSVGELVSQLALSQPAVSKHLRVLREAGLVEARVEGQRREYRLRPEAFAEVDRWLARFRALWTKPEEPIGHVAYLADDELDIAGTPV